jgi:preprotein translocase subunit SecD
MEYSSVKLDSRNKPPATTADFNGYAANLSLDLEQMKNSAGGELIYSESELLNQAVSVLKDRFNKYNIKNYTIEVNNGKIEVKVQNGDAETINTVILQENTLNFAIVDAGATQEFLSYLSAHSISLTFNEDGTLKDPSLIPNNRELEHSIDSPNDFYVINNYSVINMGKYFTAVSLVDSAFGEQEFCGSVDASEDGYAIKISLDSTGKLIMMSYTSMSSGEQMVISVNNQIIYVGDITETLQGEFYITFESSEAPINLILNELRNEVCPVIFSIDSWIETDHNTDYASRIIELLSDKNSKWKKK